MENTENKHLLIAELKRSGISHPNVLKAIAETPREVFVPEHLRTMAYENEALPIDCKQTISQPYVVACMTEAVYQDNQTHKALEIGTGSGYQAAVLSQLYDEVYSVERIETLLNQAKEKFKQLNLNNIYCQYSDGYQGWQQHAPFDAIIVTAAAPSVPDALLSQLADNGKMIIPVDNTKGYQQLQLITRYQDQFHTQYLDSVMFVPLVAGKHTE